jgi:hypothetical protein
LSHATRPVFFFIASAELEPADRELPRWECESFPYLRPGTTPGATVRIGGGGGGSTREGKREEAAVAEAVGEPPLAALAWIFWLGRRNWSYLEHSVFSCEEVGCSNVDDPNGCTIGWLGIKVDVDSTAGQLCLQL